MKAHALFGTFVVLTGLCGVAPVHAADKADQFLPNLQLRVQQMLDVQKQVNDGTGTLHKTIQGRPDKQPRFKDQKDGEKLAAMQREIIAEAHGTLKDLTKNGSAAAFEEVIREQRTTMDILHKRMDKGDFGKDAQTIQADVKKSLEEVITALKKR